jgi:hypothetical protein
MNTNLEKQRFYEYVDLLYYSLNNYEWINLGFENSLLKNEFFDKIMLDKEFAKLFGIEIQEQIFEINENDIRRRLQVTNPHVDESTDISEVINSLPNKIITVNYNNKTIKYYE